jgi:D-xylose transport system permease protein
MYSPRQAPARPVPDALPISTFARQYIDRVTHGELGALPALGGVVVFSTIFALLRPVFLSPANLANLLTQAATISIIAMGLVFVLLIGEIDVSIGYTGGVGGAVAALLVSNGRLPWYAAVVAALLTGVVIGLTLGTLVVKVRMPSFIVTIGALLGLQGVVLVLIGGDVNTSIHDSTFLAIANGVLAPTASWLLWAAGMIAYFMIEFRRKRKGLHHRTAAPDPMPLIVWRICVVTAVSAAMVYVLNRERSLHPDTVSIKGVPIILPVTAALVIWWTFVLRRTTYGHRLHAIARGRQRPPAPASTSRRIRISAFVICSGMAAVGGVVAVSHAGSVDADTGGLNVLLDAMAAAVIGGTSLFGGKGRAVDAVFGGTLMAVIDNGMAQLELGAGAKNIVACVYLLVVVAIDVARRPRSETRSTRGPELSSSVTTSSSRGRTGTSPIGRRATTRF